MLFGFFVNLLLFLYKKFTGKIIVKFLLKSVNGKGEGNYPRLCSRRRPPSNRWQVILNSFKFLTIKFTTQFHSKNSCNIIKYLFK